MGTKVRITLPEDSDYDPEDCGVNEVHAMGQSCGDAGTKCGMHFVDGIVPHETKEPVSCTSCICVLETEEVYVRRKGKWY